MFHLESLEVGLILDNFNKPHAVDEGPTSQLATPTLKRNPFFLILSLVVTIN